MYTKERIKEVEDFLKNCIIFKYQKVLPESSVLVLKEKDYIDEEEIKNEKDLKKIQSNMLKRMMDSLINITCELEVSFSDDELEKITYGEYLEQGLIELYTQKIAKEYNIDFEENPILKDNMDMAMKVYQILKEKLDTLVFNSNAIEILESTGVQELIEENDALALEKYIDEKAEVTSLKASSDEEKENMKHEFSIDDSLRLTEINGKKVIQYIDEQGETHLVEIPDDFILSDIYKKIVIDKKEGQTIDSKAFFNEIKSRFGEIYLDTELDKRLINKKSKDQFEYVANSDEFSEQRKNGEVLTDSNAEIFALTSTNQLVEAKRKNDHIEAAITSKNETTEFLSAEDINPTNEKEDVSEDSLSDEDRNKIYDKAENRELSLQELRDLKRALVDETQKRNHEELAEDIIENVDNDDLKRLNSAMREPNGPKLSMHNKYPYAAYASSHILFFILSMIISLALLIGAISLVLYK